MLSQSEPRRRSTKPHQTIKRRRNRQEFYSPATKKGRRKLLMGNRTSSCFYPGHKGMIKLVDANGKLQSIAVTTAAITAAELMLDNPGFAVSPLDDLVKTGRIPAICADEVLRGGKTYLLVPLSKVNAKVTDHMMEALERTLFTGKKRSSLVSRRRSGLFRSGGCSRDSRVSPVNVEAEEVVAREVKLDLLSALKGKSLCGGMIKITSSGRWCPALDPILEE